MDAVCDGSKNVEEKKMETTLKELSSLIKNDDSIQFEDNNKNMEVLKRFLRARKFNVERAFKSAKKYFRVKTTQASLLAVSRPEMFKSLYANHAASIMRNRDAKGRQIIWLTSESWDPTEFTHLQWLVSVFLVLEEMVLNEDTQRNGLIMICDFRGLYLNQIRHVSLKSIQLQLDTIQETLPVSLKEIHVVNPSVLLNIGWALYKPFIKEKLRKRILFHGVNMENLHKFVSPTILPSELGGHLSVEQAVDNDFLNAFLQKNSLYT